MNEVVKTLTRESYPGAVLLKSRCKQCEHTGTCGVSEAFHEGYWERHILETGHTVVIERVTP